MGQRDTGAVAPLMTTTHSASGDGPLTAGVLRKVLEQFPDGATVTISSGGQLDRGWTVSARTSSRL